MSDSTGRPTGEPTSGDAPFRKDTRNIPPLVWIVVVAAVLVAILAFGHWRSTHVTPHGGTAPAADNGAVTAPATSTPGASE